jgi:hypothetical protein
MSTPSTLTGVTTAPSRAALRGVTILVAAYLGLSVLTIVGAFVFRDDPSIVNTAVWIRGSIVAVSAAIMLRFAIGAGRGDARHYLRLRLMSAGMVVAIIVILTALPGDFPLWMRFEQAACGAILVVVVVIANRRRLRSSFERVAEVEAR